MALDFFIFFLLGLYMDKVIPQPFGQRKSLFFLCMPSSYRCCRRERHPGANATGDALLDNDADGDQFESHQMPLDNYEPAPVICKRLEASDEYLKIENLSKTFNPCHNRNVNQTINVSIESADTTSDRHQNLMGAAK